MREYFKFRDPFDKNPHQFEIGNPIKFDRKKGDNFFFKKFFSLNINQYAEYYLYHLQWFLSENPGLELEFFTHILEKIEDQIAHYRKKSLTALDTIESLEALRQFKNTLNQFDKWHIKKGLEVIISEKDFEISVLKAELSKLKKEIKFLNRYEADQKIRILDGNLVCLIDLFRQIQDLETPDGAKLARSQSQSPWYKMIAKYFQQGEGEISIETLRNYFPANKTGKLIKGSDIPESIKLFKIVPINSISK